jgi:Methyltransferase domain/Glycosyl transferase family 2
VSETPGADRLSLSPHSPKLWNGLPASPEEEATAGKTIYLQVLERLHRELAPASYLEIGVRHGISLSLARCPALGVDPNPEVNRELPETTEVVRLTSDEFFRDLAGNVSPDLTFIDGMHLFEYALRDFMNVERCSPPGAVVVFDDVFPNHPLQANRVRASQVWTGDVWRVADILTRLRSDLLLLSIDTAPTGLLLVAGLDPENRVLWDGYDQIVREASSSPDPPPEVIARSGAIDPSSPHFGRVLEAIKKLGAVRNRPRRVVNRTTQGFRGPPEPIPPTSDDEPVHAPALSKNVPKISVVVVSYNMARELPRTIRSLSPVMQRDVDPADVEVILVDNGSTEPFDEAELRRIMPTLIVRRVANATPSPVPAVNLGLGLARADLVGVCIDGARMSSPGILAKALAASRLHPRPVIGTIAFHLGPQPQPLSIKEGYNQYREDQLLTASGWEADGYQLFPISSFAISSSGGWFQLPTESNLFFLKADHWQTLGGWDEHFRSPGGGLANLDMWARACVDPDSQVIMLLGEATFHQVHGGVATNNTNAPHELFAQEYSKIRGRPYERPRIEVLYFGGLPEILKSSIKQSLSRFAS